MTVQPFTYIESESSLYGPDGTLLRKEVFCPKALNWNQLTADDPEERSRGCWHCDERVLNLDVVSPEDAVEILTNNHSQCIYGSEKSVRFLRDPMNPELPSGNDDGFVVIKTARTLFDIERARRCGFWPVVKLINYDTDIMNSKFQVEQNVESGEIKFIGDYRESTKKGWEVVVPWTNYYQYYQSIPIAAYLIPKGLPAGSAVLVPDPIEDIYGGSWNQGNCWRAENVPGVWDGRNIILNEGAIKLCEIVG
jgi:hypothetical protein